MSVMGFRWLAIGPGGRLQSHCGTIWPPNEPLKAMCMFSLHRAPDFECGCGIYSYKDTDLAWGYQPTPQARYRQDGFKVFAAIECWGLIIEHELGWRSEYAAIRAIWSQGTVHAVYQVDRHRNIDGLIARYDIGDE